MSDQPAAIRKRMLRRRHANTSRSVLAWFDLLVRIQPRRASLHILVLSVGLAVALLSTLIDRSALGPLSEAGPLEASDAAPDSMHAAESTKIEAAPRLTTHVVEPGDTLRSLAERFGVSVATIAASNKLSDPDVIRVGQELVMLPTTGVLHTINPGETLGQVAERYGADASAVASANQVAPVPERPVLGQKLVVPGVEPGLPQARPRAESTEPAAKPSEDGEQVTSLASSLMGPAAAQRSGEARSPVVYEVQEGDSLRSLATQFGVSTRSILSSNELDDPDLIPVGTKLKVLPGSGEASVAETSSAKEKPVAQSKNPVVYEVQQGDSIRSLATQFGVSIKTILVANNLSDPDLITVGTKLKVLPVSGVEHQVGKGESLADIAAAYKVDLGPIVDFNGLADPDLITVGDKVVIPGASAKLEVPTVAQAAPRVTPASPASAVASLPAAQPAAPRIAQPAPPAAAPSIAQPAPPAAAPSIAQAAPRPAAPPAVQAAIKPAAPAAAAAIVAPAPAVRAGGSSGIAGAAMNFLGSRYVFGGSSPGGFDCSGFVWYVHKAAGISISRGLWGQLNGGPRISRDNLQAGDTVFFANTYMPGLSHVGIYIGAGRFIHAVDERKGVAISGLGDAYWAGRYVGASRLY